MGKKCKIPDMSSICPNINQEDLDNVNINTKKALKQMGALQTTVGKAMDYVKEVNGQKNTEKKERIFRENIYKPLKKLVLKII